MEYGVSLRVSDAWSRASGGLQYTRTRIFRLLKLVFDTMSCCTAGRVRRFFATLSATSTQLPRSGIRDVMAQAAALEAAGHAIIHLEVGQPDLEPAAHIVAAAAAAARDPSSSRYCPNAGLVDAREAVAEYFERRAPNVPTRATDIMITPGAVLSIAASYACILDPGDEVLTPDPGWPNYGMAARLLGATPVTYACPASSGWQPSVAAMRASLSAQTRAIVLSNPSNPCGATMSPQLLREVLDFAEESDLFVISDEIYSDLAPPGSSPPLSALAHGDSDRLIVVSGVSKAYSMCGYRVGFLRCSRPGFISTANKVVETLISCTSPVSQAGLVAALRGDQQCVRDAAAQYGTRRRAVVELLRARGRFEYEPTGAFYLLIRTGERVGADELIERCGVAVAPGETFGAEAAGYVRISLASDIEALLVGVTRICDYLDTFDSE